MSRKKFDEKCYKETMDCLHASDDVLEEVLKMTENRNAEGDKIQDDGQETRNRSKYAESGLQSRALPPVPLMMEQMNFGMSRGGVREIM